MENEEMLAAIKGMFAEEYEITDAKIEATQKDTIQQAKALLENGVEKQIRLLAESHAQILARLPDAQEQVKIKSGVSTLEQCYHRTHAADQPAASGQYCYPLKGGEVTCLIRMIYRQ